MPKLESGFIRRSIIAILMSLYVFLAGIPYGNEPAKVECTIKAEASSGVTPYGDNYLAFDAEVTVENIGRPFITSSYDNRRANIRVFKIVNGKKELLKNLADKFYDASMPQNELIKHGQVLILRERDVYIQDYEPGEYIVQAFVEHSDKPCITTITLP